MSLAVIFINTTLTKCQFFVLHQPRRQLSILRPPPTTSTTVKPVQYIAMRMANFDNPYRKVFGHMFECLPKNWLKVYRSLDSNISVCSVQSMVKVSRCNCQMNEVNRQEL